MGKNKKTSRRDFLTKASIIAAGSLVAGPVVAAQKGRPAQIVPQRNLQSRIGSTSFTLPSGQTLTLDQMHDKNLVREDLRILVENIKKELEANRFDLEAMVMGMDDLTGAMDDIMIALGDITHGAVGVECYGPGGDVRGISCGDECGKAEGIRCGDGCDDGGHFCGNGCSSETGDACVPIEASSGNAFIDYFVTNAMNGSETIGTVSQLVLMNNFTAQIVFQVSQ
ncbi:MAG: hypothetical protein ABII18_02740 [bacterium]|nr:hypothetical protein [bacterium]MBU1918398.1 hypothetical protein [bacterium]